MRLINKLLSGSSDSGGETTGTSRAVRVPAQSQRNKGAYKSEFESVKEGSLDLIEEYYSGNISVNNVEVDSGQDSGQYDFNLEDPAHLGADVLDALEALYESGVHYAESEITESEEEGKKLSIELYPVIVDADIPYKNANHAGSSVTEKRGVCIDEVDDWGSFRSDRVDIKGIKKSISPASTLQISYDIDSETEE